MFKNSKKIAFLLQSLTTLKIGAKFILTTPDFAQNIHIPLMRTFFAKRTILFQGPNIWNNLPRNITTISSIAIFKRTIKNDFLAYYQVKS